ncbi:MAG: bacteriohemerythrin [Nevskiales bacterium]|nr:bacteriohemerythrin [Nevskiales bacterium]
MSFVQWSPELDVGDPKMNAQHQRLIDIINRFHDVLQQQAPLPELVAVFTEVVDFAKEHFRDEETLMQAHGYPGLDEHLEIHHRFVARVTELLLQLRSGQRQVAADALNFLTDWLTDHIKGTDRQYRPYVAPDPGP